jgi:hypothetical protein
MSRAAKIFRFDLVEAAKRWYAKHSGDLKLFGILYLVNIFIFGQRLFFYVLPSDDYMRFGGDTNTKMLITHAARWAQTYLSDYLFAGHLIVLPYIHGLIGVFIFTLMGFLTAKYWRIKGALETAVVTLLISATPMFAHNFLFASNITIWILLLLGFFGFLLLHKKGAVWKIFGFVALVLSIAGYQTIIQILLVVVIVRVLLDILESETAKKIGRVLLHGLYIVASLAIAYLVSVKINQYILEHHHWQKAHRLAQAKIDDLATLLHRIEIMYSSPIDLLYFQEQLQALMAALVAFGSLLVVMALFRQGFSKQAFFKLVLAALFVTTLPIIVNLPLLLGVQIPTRAHLAVGWVIAGFVALGFFAAKGLARSLLALAALGLIVVNVYYITYLYDVAYRQTDMDIARARTIVERIRTHDGYKKEPVALYIEGQRPYSVQGWGIKWQQPFNSYWARYPLFRHFTDLQFHVATQEERKRIFEYLKKNFKQIAAYPGKNSVIVHDGVALVVLDPRKLNAALQKHWLLGRFPERKPDAQGNYALYIENGVLYYKKENCTKQDRNRFFLRIYPEANETRTFIGKTRIKPFQNMDFRFEWFGEQKEDGSCVIAVQLPRYPIRKIRTGQFDVKGLLWDTTIDLSKTRKVKEDK